MTDRAAFLAAIAARPDDDLPRLVFADWLDEHGEADRAAFVRLQCAGDPDSLRRAAELETRHRAAWLGPLARVVFRAEFRRGFVEHAVLPTAAFLAHAPDLRRHTPLRGVTLLGARRVLPHLVRGPHLAGLAALHLTGGRLGDDGVRFLAACPHLAGLATLRLGDNSLTDAGAIALARGPHLAGLTTLVLRDNLIGDGGAWELAHAPFFGRLATLDLAGNEVGPSGVGALRSSPRLVALTHLDVTDQRAAAGRRVLALAATK
ncbi:MAG TPA: TIGR02996 domain-containing protein [Gemmataceae bacterium]|jgi:uncharacterized protein (TIGR02996 family)